MDRAPPVFESTVEVLYLLDKKRVSSSMVSRHHQKHVSVRVWDWPPLPVLGHWIFVTSPYSKVVGLPLIIS